MKRVFLHLYLDTALAVATQTDAEEVNVTEETSETEADAFSDGDDGTAVPSQEQTDDAFTAGTDTGLLHCRTRRRQQQMLRMPLDAL